MNPIIPIYKLCTLNSAGVIVEKNPEPELGKRPPKPRYMP